MVDTRHGKQNETGTKNGGKKISSLFSLKLDPCSTDCVRQWLKEREKGDHHRRTLNGTYLKRYNLRKKWKEME